MTKRAAFLQSFHTGRSESQRKAQLDAIYGGKTVEEYYADLPDTGEVVSINPSRSNAGNGSPRMGRKVTDKQAALILKLIAEKDLSNLKILAGQTVDPAKVPDMEIGRGSALIEKLFACPNKATHSTKITDQGSEKQRAFLASLMAQLNLSESDINSWGYKSISDAISHLLTVAKHAKPQVAKTDDLVGMWTDGKRIIRAYLNREKTRVLAKELIQEGNDYSFEYLGMAQYHVKGMRKMTLDEAKAFGTMTNTCCVCATELTDPDSQKKGIGPWCEKNFG